MPLSQQADVDTPGLAYREMAEKWPLIQDLLGGTRTMRLARTKWLPQEPKERQISYENRLARSILFNGYGDAVDKVVSKPFAKPITLNEEDRLSEELQDLQWDVDRTGKDLTQFAKECFRTAVNYGLVHILVDYPTTRGDESRAEERALKIRPYFVHVSPEDLIGWQTESVIGGPKRLVRVRIRESQIEPDGAYGDKRVEYIRDIGPYDWVLWRSENKQWAQVGGGEFRNGFGEIPIVTCYVNRTGFMTGEPPLEDLAWLNLAHWQSYSDQRNYLRFARIGFIAGTGFSQEEQKALSDVGVNTLVWSTNEKAQMQVVEHQGAAATIGREDLKDLEERMRLLGLLPFVQRTGGVTATEKAMDEGRTATEIQSWIRSAETAIENAYDFAARWRGEELPEEFGVDIFNEFTISLRAADDVDRLIKARVAREISQHTFLAELKRRGLLADDLDIDAEIVETQSEAPAMGGFVGTGDVRKPGDDEDGTEDRDDDDETINAA